MQNRPHIQKIILDENSYANAGMSSLLPIVKKAMFLFFCLFLFVLRILMNLDFAFFALQTHSRRIFNMQGERIM